MTTKAANAKSPLVPNTLSVSYFDSGMKEIIHFDGEPQLLKPDWKARRDNFYGFPPLIWLYFRNSCLVALVKIGDPKAADWLYSRRGEVWPQAIITNGIRAVLCSTFSDGNNLCADSSDSIFLRFNKTLQGTAQFWTEYDYYSGVFSQKEIDAIRQATAERTRIQHQDGMPKCKHKYVFRESAGQWLIIFDGSPLFAVSSSLGASFFNYLLKHPGRWTSSKELYDNCATITHPDAQKAGGLGNEDDRDSAGISISSSPDKSHKLLTKDTIAKTLTLKHQLDNYLRDPNISSMDREETEKEVDELGRYLKEAAYSFPSQSKKLHDNVRKHIGRFKQSLQRSKNPACRAFYNHLQKCIPGCRNQAWFYDQPRGIKWFD